MTVVIRQIKQEKGAPSSPLLSVLPPAHWRLPLPGHALQVWDVLTPERT